MQLHIQVTLDVTYHEENHTCEIQNQCVQILTPQALPLQMQRKLGVAEIRYGIFTLGSKSVIGQVLPRDTDVTVFFDGVSYSAHTHKTSGGRVDRLSALLRQFHVGSELSFEYNPSLHTLYVEACDPS